MLKRRQKFIQKKLNEFEHFVVDVIYERETTGVAVVFAALLRCLSVVFGLIARLRLKLYQGRIFQQAHLGCLVVAVGNITVGGTGKTPVVEKFARALAAKGRKVAILSRGYKSRSEPGWRKLVRVFKGEPEPPPRIVSSGAGPELPPDVAGDEPWMLAKNLPGVMVIVDKDRVSAGRYAIRKFGVDTIILDDGFQYLPMKAQINLLLVDKNNPFGNGHLLPRGILREPIHHMSRANYVLVTKSDGKPDEELFETLREHKPGLEIMECTHRPKFLQEVNGPELLPLSALQGAHVAAFSGIAVPEGFENFLRQHGAEIRFVKRFNDHYRFTFEDLSRICDRACENDLRMIVTTEKDAARLGNDYRAPEGIKLYYLRLEIEMLTEEANFDALVERLCRLPEATRF